jgi:hypothetical protein
MNSCLIQLLTQGYNLFETVIYQSYNSHELHKKLAWILSTILPSFVFLSGIIFIIIYWKYHKNMSDFREIQKGTLKFNFVFLLSCIIYFFLFEIVN